MRSIGRQARILVGGVLVGAAALLVLSQAWASFPGQNGLIAWSSGGDIVRSGPDGTDLINITTVGGDQPAWAPQTVVQGPTTAWSITFVREVSGEGDIFTSLPNGELTVNRSDSAADDRQAAFSRDGTEIVFASDRGAGDDAYRLYRMDADGTGDPTAITTTGDLGAGTDDDAPEWSWAEDRIVFQRGVPSDGAGNTAIFAIDADGSNLSRLTEAGAPGDFADAYSNLVRPKWSPDGAEIVYAALDGDCGALFIMNADGSEPTHISAIDGCAADPTWAPNGDSILFKGTDIVIEGEDPADGLFAINPSSSEIAEISDDPDATSPDWQPIGGPPPGDSTSTSSTSSTSSTTTSSTTSTTSTTVVPPPTTGGGGARVGAITGCDASWVKEGFLTNAFHQHLGCGDAQAIDLAGTRYGVINGCGASWVKQGDLDNPFRQQTGCGDARAISTSSNRFGVINGCGAAYVKNAATSNRFIQQTACGDSKALDVADNRVGVITACGALWVKQGSVEAPFIQQTQCGDAQAMEVSADRIAVINGCGSLWVKEGSMTAPFLQHTGCGDAKAVSITDDRVGVINGCSSFYAMEGPLLGRFVQQTSCGDAVAIDVAPNRLAVITACHALWAKQGSLDRPFSQQLTCGDANAVSMNHTT